MRRLLACCAAAMLVLAACGGTDTGVGSGGNGPDATDQDDTATGDLPECASEKPEAGEVGITETQIKIAAVADTGSPLAPGLFQTSLEGVRAWADLVNRAGGLACRTVVIDEYDSKLSANEAKTAVLNACGRALAMVGTTALFLQAVDDLEECQDSAGEPTGIPDIPVVQTESAHQCSDVSFATIPFAGLCPYGGEGPRDFRLNAGPARWLLENVDPDLHGVFLIPSDLPSTIASTIIQVRGFEQAGIGNDGEFGVSGRAPQSEYTPFVQALVDSDATFAQSTGSVDQTIFFRKEAQVQGVSDVTWLCLLQCYDTKLIDEGGDAVEGTYVSVNIVPFEEADTNPTLQAFLGEVDRPDAFGVQAFLSGLLFAQVVEDIVATDGINGITRAKIIDGLRQVEDFDGNKMVAPIDVGSKRPGSCFALLQVQDGEFVRIHPPEPASFDCSEENIEEFTIDATREFTG